MNPIEGRTKIFTFLIDEFGWGAKTAELWLKSDNLNFGGTSPEKLIKAGRGDKVLYFLNYIKQTRTK